MRKRRRRKLSDEEENKDEIGNEGVRVRVREGKLEVVLVSLTCVASHWSKCCCWVMSWVTQRKSIGGFGHDVIFLFFFSLFFL